MKAKKYIFPMTKKSHWWTDRENKVYLHDLIGETLTNIFMHNIDGLHGLQLARFKVGSSTIIAHRRLTDIKVTIYEDLK